MKLKNLSILFISLVLALIVGTTQTYAQDHPDTTTSHKHNMMGKGHKHMMDMKDSTSMHKMMKDKNHKMHDMKKDSMHKDESSKHEHKAESIVREGIIDLEAIDKNKDGKVFQDQMCWNVISDEPGECPLCGMTLKEVTLNKAKENLLKNNFKVKNSENDEFFDEASFKTGKDLLADNNESEKTVWNKYCPVTGKNISKSAETLEYDGKLIGFCCAGAEHHKIFQKDPQKYMNNLSSDGQKFIGDKKK